MKRLRRLIVAALALTATPSLADVGALPLYASDGAQRGEIRIWGYDLPILKRWYTGFQKIHSRIRISDSTHAGTAAAIGSLYTGTGDVGFLGRAAYPMEIHAFRRYFGYDPLEIVVATGTFDGKDTPGVVIFLNAGNPLSKITLRQLDGILGSQRTGGWQRGEWTSAAARSSKENIRTWGQLGLTGEWADQPINVYGYDLSFNGSSYWIQQKVFQGGDTWNPALVQFPLTEPGRESAAPKSGAHQIMQRLGADRYGIAFGAMKFSAGNPHVKSIAVAGSDGGPYIEPTKATFTDGTYPLTQYVHMYVNREPSKPLSPHLKEFLRYILSREAQLAVSEDDAYLPLTAELVNAQLEKLE